MLVNNFSNTISCQGTDGLNNTEFRNQHQCVTEIDTKPNNMCENGIETSHDENNNVTSKEAKQSCDEHNERETTDRAYQEEEEVHTTDTPVSSSSDSYAELESAITRIIYLSKYKFAIRSKLNLSKSSSQTQRSGRHFVDMGTMLATNYITDYYSPLNFLRFLLV